MNQRRPTSFDIAALAGVSQPTVSRALSGNPSVSDETRAKVLAAAKELNYTVDKNASGLRRQQSRTIALLFFEDPTPDDTLINPFYLSMVGSLTRACAKAGYDLLISFQQLSSDWHVDYEDSRKADGIILLGYGDYLEAMPRLEQLVGQRTHFVRWGAARAGQIGTTVGSDNEQGGYLAGRHLVDQGRKRIAFLGNATPAEPEYLERWTGFARALAERGIDSGDALKRSAEASEESGRRAVEQMLADGLHFDAIFAINDLAAIGAMRALHEAGKRIPEDVAIVGFDDLAAARLSEPALTTVAQDTRRAGEALIETLVAKIEERAPDSVTLPVTLVVRQSS
ncbi:LacI family DNA-binding transcriptional regulator [Sphingomonas sp. LY29]|uniref:LacI family DNA-binding transcriptional regulator n=1 Tax=Sphingomonas sp. LY29 TaxID=3095341 RepID=UPI002D79819A|nr:LacI family DNA-binding transcriptional regulator [Sphingomonas sp. LY29]WRP27057.1 LacI family DNA-binding transcriptional regulator [Sphingomonas sp. LY29]